MRRGLVLCCFLVVGLAALLAGSANAGPGLFFGFSGDEPKEGDTGVTPARDLGAKGLRVTLRWDGEATALPDPDLTELDRVVAAAPDFRIIVAVVGLARNAPLTEDARDRYCTFTKNLLEHYPTINDVVIWNEPNLSMFWQPQWNPDRSSAAPAAYEALLARCWDVLHEFRPGVNVIGPATGPHGNDSPDAPAHLSHSPANFIRKLGDAYRASGRVTRIFDTVGQHVYGNHAAERPWKRHTSNGYISEGDWDKLMASLTAAFSGTGQAIPGECFGGGCVWIWYLEAGFDTEIDADKAALYSGTENFAYVVPDDVGGEPSDPTPGAETLAPDQSTQIRYAVHLAYCQPYVQAYFNFLLFDEPDLGRWQSAPFWVDRTPKGSYPAFQEAIAQANSAAFTCPPPTPPPGPTAVVQTTPTRGVKILWSAASSPIGVSGYDVYRDGAFLVRTSSLGYIDKSVEGARTYSYSVRAFDAAGNGSEESEHVSALAPPQLTVAKAGDGAGTVSSEPESGIACGASCVAFGAPGSTVTLTAVPDPGSTFTGWSGACFGAASCTVTLDSDKTVTATFAAPLLVATIPLASLRIDRRGRGAVTSAPAGIVCGARCSAEFAPSASVRLRARAEAGHRLARWGGACAAAGRAATCTLRLDSALLVSVKFEPRPCLVPRLVGRTLRAGRNALKRSNCRLGRVRAVYSRTVKRGRVAAQKPRPGTRRAAGARVNVVVSRGRF